MTSNGRPLSISEGTIDPQVRLDSKPHGPCFDATDARPSLHVVDLFLGFCAAFDYVVYTVVNYMSWEFVLYCVDFINMESRYEAPGPESADCDSRALSLNNDMSRKSRALTFAVSRTLHVVIASICPVEETEKFRDTDVIEKQERCRGSFSGALGVIFGRSGSEAIRERRKALIWTCTK
jgi:hypothetical protein